MGADLLAATHDAARQEVAHRAGLGARERLRTTVGDRRRVRARAAATAPPVAVISVEVRTDIAGPGRRLAVLAPVVEPAVADVVVGAIRVDREDEPDLAAVDDVRDARVRAISVDQPAHDLDDHLGAHVLVGVVAAVEQDLGLGLIGRDVVRDLHRPHVAAAVALADAEARRDVGMRVGDRLRQCGDLGMGVVALVALGELGPGKGRARDEEEGCERGDRDGGSDSAGAARARHRSMMTVMSSRRDAGMGPLGGGRNVRGVVRPALRGVSGGTGRTTR